MKKEPPPPPKKEPDPVMSAAHRKIYRTSLGFAVNSQEDWEEQNRSRRMK